MNDKPHDPNEPKELTPVQRLSRDLAMAAATLSDAEVRFLVDAYYQMQDDRIRHDGQIRAMDKAPHPEDKKEPHIILDWLAEQSSTLEDQIRRALDKYSANHPDGVWLRSVVGIGPVIAAGLLAHIDILQAPTVGHIWRFAGLDPTSKWEKGKKRPHNAELKVLCWKAGESFVKQQNRDGCIYGQFYRQRKEIEVRKNDAGDFAQQAADILVNRKIGKDTDAYKAYVQGKLPPAHIHARARRYAVKLFLAHLHEHMYRRAFKSEPPLPYPIAHLDHVHKIEASGETTVQPLRVREPILPSEPSIKREPNLESEPTKVREPSKKSAKKKKNK